MRVHPIYTEVNNCQDCYKCVRECPVKAIKIENHSASIIAERCIYCGHCTTICPASAKKVREDVKTVKYFFDSGYKVVASLAPSFRSEFSDYPENVLIGSLHKLGFTHVSETALGAEMVSAAVNNWIGQQNGGTYISTCCPTIVDLVKKYYPQHCEKLTPITTPMLAHGTYLKQELGENIKVVFIGPCIAKKKEAEKNNNAIDAVITFEKLREWFQKAGINPSTTANHALEFFPVKSGIGSLYPIDGGMISTLSRKTTLTDTNFMCFSGLDNIIDIFENLDSFKSNSTIFLELLACRGGCINGPVSTCTKNTVWKRRDIIEGCNEEKNEHQFINQNCTALNNNFEYIRTVEEKKFTKGEITEALRSVGKYSEKDELNCSGCGYESCKDFAGAVLANIAEPTMCVSYMRQTAQRQASLLMQKMPYAVVLVDDKLKIIEANQNFALMAGSETELAFEVEPGLPGADLSKILPEYKYFDNLLKTGSEIIEKDIRINNQAAHLSIFTIQKHKIVCGIMHTFGSSEISRAEIAKRSKQVIRLNLKTVQKIALLLGENASQTEALLNSLIEAKKNE